MAKKSDSKRSKAASRTGGRKNKSEEKQLIERLRVAVRSLGPRFLKDPNITSVGIGYKSRNAVEHRPRTLCLQFTVARKVSGDQLEALGTRVIPETVEFDGEPLPTDVIEREFEPAHHLRKPAPKDKRKQRLDPLLPGISVSHPSGTAGTLGAIVYDLHEGHACMLSNWHVLHTPEGSLGDAVVQPGPYDDNRVRKNGAGTLLRSHLGAAGDCAIARIEERGLDPKVLELGVAASQVAQPDLGDRVVKSGRTTGVTYGIVTRIETLTRINYGGSVGDRQIGGFEIGPDEIHPAVNNEISMGGDSGSIWLIADGAGKPTDIMAGLHFAGEGQNNPREHAIACYAHAVLNKLEIGFEPPAAAAADEWSNRTGYDREFLGHRIPPPRAVRRLQRDVVKLNGSPLIPYTHFSVSLSKSRRLAHFVAWNIDGGAIKRVSRNGIRFRVDPRIAANRQVDNRVYRANPLDRGHIARRADLVWGPLPEARRANRDSFYYTNITPQHEAFNQSTKSGLWGLLENAIFEDTDVADLKMSVFAGPIFKPDDPEYRGIQLPRNYWKLIAYVDEENSNLKAKAYVLTQDDLLSDIEILELDPFRLWQISIDELEQRTGLRLDGVKAADDLAASQAAEALSRKGAREVHTREDLIVG